MEFPVLLMNVQWSSLNIMGTVFLEFSFFKPSLHPQILFMSKILSIETSTEVCSVSLSENGKVIDCREDLIGMNHSKLLTVFIQELLLVNNLKASDLDAVAVSEGPGSYTGLRIGVSVAKGICFAVNKPLIAVSSLEAMAKSVLTRSSKQQINIEENDLLVPMIDARRMEVYRTVFTSKLEVVKKVDAVIIDETSFQEELNQSKIFYFGNGAEKCRNVLNHPNAIYVEGIITSANHMVELAFEKFQQKDFVDVAYFEPFYLKDFIALKSKKNILKSL